MKRITQISVAQGRK